MSLFDSELSSSDITELMGQSQALLEGEAMFERYSKFVAYGDDASYFAEVARIREVREQLDQELTGGAKELI